MNKEKTLVLDLDETLVHCTDKENDDIFHKAESFVYRVETQDNGFHEYKVYIRPYLYEFLAQASKYFQLVIFTSSRSRYAN